MKFSIRAVTIVLVMCFLLLLTPIASAASADFQTVRIKGTVWFVQSMSLYAIMSEDGKKYEPIKKLPNEFLIDGLPVVVEGKIRDDLVGERMWGQPLEVVQIFKASQYIGPEDRIAISLLLTRMDAFNTKNLAKLQDIDVVAKNLNAAQFDSWIADCGNYSLHYVDTSPAIAGTTINGTCLYSRQHSNSIDLFSGADYTVMKFTISKSGDNWKFTATSNYVPEIGTDMNQVISDMMDAANQKYGTTDLAAWKG